jgi:hypothetical protein
MHDGGVRTRLRVSTAPATTLVVRPSRPFSPDAGAEDRVKACVQKRKDGAVAQSVHSSSVLRYRGIPSPPAPQSTSYSRTR